MPYPDKPLDGPVLHWRDGAVAHLRFNRPQALNAIDVTLAEAFVAACDDIVADPAVRVIWLSAEGRAFMAGGDIGAMREDPEAVPARLIAGMHGGLRRLAGGDAPVVASVQGAVAGGGLGLLMGAADIVVAAEGTRFSVAYPAIGASCDCSTSWALPRLVGLNRALEMVLLADTIDAAEAQRIGLCNRVVPAADLERDTRTIVDRLAAGPTRAYGQMRRLVRASLATGFSDQLDAEAAGFRAAAATEDFREGVDAFVAKRRPAFKGR